MSQVPKSKLEMIAIVIAALAMLGTLGNATFTWWVYIQKERTSLDISCEPVLDEPVAFNHTFPSTETISFYYKVAILNSGSKRAYITRVNSTLIFSGNNVDGGGYGATRGLHFSPDESEIVYFYNKQQGSIIPRPLPIYVESGEQIEFYSLMETLFGKKMLSIFANTCPDRIEKNYSLRQIIEVCMNGNELHGNASSAFHPKHTDILYKLEPQLTIHTTGGRFEAEGPLLVVRSGVVR